MVVSFIAVSRWWVVLALCVLLASCGATQDRTPAVAQAYVGPATLPLRQELNLKSPVTATLRHGEPLDVLEVKRRLIKVRTAGGITGWTDIHQLMTPDRMKELRRLTEEAKTLPTQGLATSFEPLNVHTEPNRLSPVFYQIAEGGKVDVIGHKVEPRAQDLPTIPAPPPKPKSTKRKGKDKASNKVPPPPPPPAPGLPNNWQDLSRSPKLAQELKPTASAEPAKPPAPPPQLDDWTLIRTKDGHAGWVLSRMVNMAIPDDVAQYAEGHRITSYFPMGDVKDEDDGQTHHNWLWTTVGKGPLPYEFDSFRFFIWSRRHHRYETAFIQKNVAGYYPVSVDASGAMPQFSVILETDAGTVVKNTYVFNGYRVTLQDSQPYQLQKLPDQHPGGTLAVSQSQASQKSKGWYEAIKARVSKLFHQ